MVKLIRELAFWIKLFDNRKDWIKPNCQETKYWRRYKVKTEKLKGGDDGKFLKVSSPIFRLLFRKNPIIEENIALANDEAFVTEWKKRPRLTIVDLESL